MNTIQRCLFEQPHVMVCHAIWPLAFTQEEIRTWFDFGDHFYDPIKAMEKIKPIGERLLQKGNFLFINQDKGDFLQPLLFTLSYEKTRAYAEDREDLVVDIRCDQVVVEEKEKWPTHAVEPLNERNRMCFLMHYCLKRGIEKDANKIKKIFGAAWDRFTMEVKHDQ